MPSKHPTRWTLIILGAGAAVVGCFFFLREPTEGVAAPAEEPRKVSPFPELPLMTASSPASAPPVAIAPEAPASPPTSRTASVNSAPRIGSEGYGPYIERAYAGTDAAAAWEAVQWLRHCTTNEIRRQSFEQARDRGVAPEMMTQMMVEADADARRCQTVTAQHHALLPELAARAGRAGLPEVRHAYVNSLFARELSAAQRQDVAQRMRRDARAGLGPSLLNAALSDAGWGLSDEEKFAFLLAYATQFDQPGSLELLRLLREHGYLQPRGSLTRQQMAVARELGLRALEQVPARSR